MKDLTQLEKNIGVGFENKDLLRQAVVHRSYLNENRDFPLDHNERLEFLGDAVLELVVTEYLFQNYPNPEGELTNWRASLVNSEMLALVAEKIGVEDFLHLSKGEAQDSNSKARKYIIANAVEAVIGAIYLDKGYEVAKQFVADNMIVELPRILEEGSYQDKKSKFQEKAQEVEGITPTYKVISEEGLDHEKEFEVGLYLKKELISKGKGKSKQEAQVIAAEKGLELKGWS